MNNLKANDHCITLPRNFCVATTNTADCFIAHVSIIQCHVALQSTPQSWLKKPGSAQWCKGLYSHRTYSLTSVGYCGAVQGCAGLPQTATDLPASNQGLLMCPGLYILVHLFCSWMMSFLLVCSHTLIFLGMVLM